MEEIWIVLSMPGDRYVNCLIVVLISQRISKHDAIYLKYIWFYMSIILGKRPKTKDFTQ